MPKGQCKGLYSYDPEHDCYKQVATEEHYDPAERPDPIFVYRAKSITEYKEAWYIGDNLVCPKDG